MRSKVPVGTHILDRMRKEGGEQTGPSEGDAAHKAAVRCEGGEGEWRICDM